MACAVLTLATLAVYSRSLTVPFIFDDAPAIERNQTIRQLWPLNQVLAPPVEAAGATGRPLVNLSLALNYAAGGLDPRGYHLVNLALHALVGLVLFGLVRQTLLQPPLRGRFGKAALPLAFSATLLWLVHPLLTESVICVIQRNELLVSFFYLFTLWCLARSATSSRPGGWLGLGVGSCVLGMASKEVMVTAPLLALLYDRTFVGGSFAEAWKRRRPFYVALALTWGLLAVLVSQHHQRAGIVGFGLGVTPWQYLLTQCTALTTYLKLSLWPTPLVLDYGVETARSLGEVWLPGTLIIGLLAGVVMALWRRPVLGFLGAWFFVILAPSSSFVPLTTQPIAEHRMYLPLVAIVVLIVAGVYELMGKLGGAVVAAFAIGLGCMTVARSLDYRDGATIWEDTIAKRPANARAHASLANVWARQGQWEKARLHYEDAIRLRPDYADAQSDYASTLLMLNQVDLALPHFEAALRLKPDDLDIQYNLAVALGRAGRLAEAARILGNITQQRPNHAAAWNNLGDAWLKMGRRTEAITAFEQAIQVEPNFAAAHNNAGVALAALKRWPEAIGHYVTAAKLEPANVEILNNLAEAFLISGKTTEAAREYQEALRLRPDLPSLHYNLGNVWLQLNRLDDAESEFRQALKLQPDFAAAHHNLGLALTQLGRPAEAEPHFRVVLRQMPGSAAAHLNLSVALTALGRKSEALDEAEEALRLQPDSPAAQRQVRQLRTER